MGINLSFQSSTMDHSWFDVVRLHRLKENRMVPCHEVQNQLTCVAIFSLEDLTNNLGKKPLKQPQDLWMDHWETTFSGKNSDSWLQNPVSWMYLPGSTVSLPEGVIFGGSLFLWWSRKYHHRVSTEGPLRGFPRILRKGDGVLDIGSQGCC